MHNSGIGGSGEGAPLTQFIGNNSIIVYRE